MGRIVLKVRGNHAATFCHMLFLLLSASVQFYAKALENWPKFEFTKHLKNFLWSIFNYGALSRLRSRHFK